MLQNEEGIKELIHTASQILELDQKIELKNILLSAHISVEQTGYDNWDGGIYFYTITMIIKPIQFVKIKDSIGDVESELLKIFHSIIRDNNSESISGIVIIPKADLKIDWSSLLGFISRDELFEDVNYLKDVMIRVSTGGAQIQNVNAEYQKRYNKVVRALELLRIKNPNSFSDLWQWYSHWKALEMQTYKERRIFIGDMYKDLIKMLNDAEDSELLEISVNLAGWNRIERTVKEIKVRLRQAENEEQFQAIGLLSRETLISLAQAVFVEEKHPTLDGIKASNTDSKRMLEGYINAELSGSANSSLRKYARTTNDLANDLTHKRTATKRDAALCSAATIAMINLIGAIEEKF